jgi:lipid-A-disaccharide synthase-like uncharacterized protein
MKLDGRWLIVGTAILILGAVASQWKLIGFVAVCMFAGRCL